MTDPSAPAEPPGCTPLPRALHRARTRPGAPPERSWTPLGTVDAGVAALVDDAGLVRLRGRTWSLDWWIGAEDRWHHPSVEVAVRRSCTGSAPVVETAMRVPGGDVVHRAYGVQATAGAWSGPAIVVEVENTTAVPVALALVLRPVTLDGPGVLDRLAVEGTRASVDGRTAVLLERVPRDLVHGPGGTVADALAAAGTPPAPAAADGTVWRDADGRLEVAMVLPLAHTATARVLLPLDDGAGPGPAGAWDAPAAEAVVAGWGVHAADATSLSTPEPGWAEGATWAARLLRLAAADAVGELLDPSRPAPVGPTAAVRAAVIAEALAVTGADDAADVVAAGLADVQRFNGEVRLGDRSDGAVALCWAAAGTLSGRAGPERAAELLAPVGAALARLAKQARKGRLPDDPDAAARAARALVPGLLAAGQPEVAEDALRLADGLLPVGAAADAPARSRDVPWATLDDALAVRRAVRSRVPGAPALVGHLWSDRSDAGRPDAVDADGHPVGADGFDVAELAARLLAMVDLLAADGPRGPELFPVWSPHWHGAPLEVHGLRTAWGTVGAALRWHGGRPALLWEVDPAPGLDPSTSAPLVRAPGPDPTWEAAGWSGEALLAAPPAPGVPGADTSADGPADGGAGAGAPGEGHSFS